MVRFRLFKSSLDQIHFNFEWYYLKSILKIHFIQIRSRSMSDPTFSDIDFKNKMAWVWTILNFYQKSPYILSLKIITSPDSSSEK